MILNDCILILWTGKFKLKEDLHRVSGTQAQLCPTPQASSPAASPALPCPENSGFLCGARSGMPLTKPSLSKCLEPYRDS